MPDNNSTENPSATGDDEIIDLLEVVKPGKLISTKTEESENIDFSGHLDSMLEEIAKNQGALDKEEKDQAFPDPTPVNHHVDANEELEMPSMDDLDDLLESLGATAEDPETSQTAAKSTSDGDDLDSMPESEETFQGKSIPSSATEHNPELLAEEKIDVTATKKNDATVEATHNPESLAPETPSSVLSTKAAEPEVSSISIDADQIPSTALGKDSQPDTTVSDPNPQKEHVADMAVKENSPTEQVNSADATHLEVNEAEAKEQKNMLSQEDMGEEVDLNELDALLDGILSIAPPSGGKIAPAQAPSEPEAVNNPQQQAAVAPATAPPAQAPSESEAVNNPQQQAAVAPATAPPVQAPSEPEAVNNPQQQAAVAPATAPPVQAPSEPEAVNNPQQQAAVAPATAPPVQEQKSQDLSTLDNASNNLAVTDDLNALIRELRQEVIAQNAAILDLSTRLLAFETALDKKASAAAAKVIREEIAALIQPKA